MRSASELQQPAFAESITHGWLLVLLTIAMILLTGCQINIQQVGQVSQSQVQAQNTPVGNQTSSPASTNIPINKNSGKPWKPCPIACISYLREGDTGYTVFGVRLREDASELVEQVGFLKQGERFKVLEGVWCDEGKIWWRIQSLETGQSGFAADGDCETNWLMPVK